MTIYCTELVYIKMEYPYEGKKGEKKGGLELNIQNLRPCYPVPSHDGKQKGKK